MDQYGVLECALKVEVQPEADKTDNKTVQKQIINKLSLNCLTNYSIYFLPLAALVNIESK